MEPRKGGRVTYQRRDSFYMDTSVRFLIVPHLTAADVSVAPNKNLIDLSWPYNEKTIAWVDFRNFSMRAHHGAAEAVLPIFMKLKTMNCIE